MLEMSQKHGFYFLEIYLASLCGSIVYPKQIVLLCLELRFCEKCSRG